MSTPYLITDSSTESSSEDIQNSLQETRNSAEPDYSEGSNSKNSIKHNHHKHSAKINRSKEQCLRIRQKVAPVYEYIDELSNELSDETFKLCKICQNKWAEGISISTVNRHFKVKHPLIFKDFQQDDSNRPSFYSMTINTERNRIESLNYNLLKWIIIKQQPFSMVEDNSFIKLVSNLDPCYEMSCRQMLSINIQKQFDLARVKIKEILKMNKNKVHVIIK